MTAKWTSRRKQFEKELRRAVDKGLIGAASVPLARIKRELRGGYTSGDFSQGENIRRAFIGDPVTEDGVRVIRIGSSWDVALFWELGHLNLFTANYERKEIWVPAMVDTRLQQAETYNRIVIKSLKSAMPAKMPKTGGVKGITE